MKIEVEMYLLRELAKAGSVPAAKLARDLPKLQWLVHNIPPSGRIPYGSKLLEQFVEEGQGTITQYQRLRIIAGKLKEQGY